MKVERVAKRIVVSSTDGQWSVIIDKLGFRNHRMIFLHDSSERPLNKKYTYSEDMAVVLAKKFVNNPE